MNSHHFKHLKSHTKEYEEQLKHGWKSHIGKIELQKGSMFFTDTAFHITYFFIHWWAQCFIFCLSNKLGEQKTFIQIHISRSGPHTTNFKILLTYHKENHTPKTTYNVECSQSRNHCLHYTQLSPHEIN